MKRGLQIVLVILSLIPLYFAVTGILGGAAALNGGTAVANGLDNQFRYLSAYYLSLFFLTWWVLADLENRGSVLRLLILAIFIGGLARLYSHMSVGPASSQEFTGMILELGSPLIVLWQAKVAKNA